MLDEAGLTELKHRGGRVTSAGNGHRGLVVKQAIKQRCETGHGQVQMLTNLAGQSRSLFDEVTPMARSQL